MVQEELIVKYLAGEAEDHEKITVEQWRSLSSVNEAEFKQVEKLWLTSAALKNSEKFNVEKAWSKVSTKIATPAKGRVISIKRVWLAAASVVLLIGISGILFKYLSQEELLYTSAKTEIVKLSLSDGSDVLLKSGNIEYPKTFKGKTRHVELKSGTAFFQITKDSLKPFEIIAGETNITVLGTGFEVSTNNNFTSVKVNSGKVRFITPAGESFLTAGMTSTYSYSNKHIETIENKEVNSLSYATGKLEFRNASLQDVVRDLNTHYDSYKIQLSGNIAECRMTATFDKNSLQDVLEVIRLTMHVEILTDDKNKVISIVGKGCLP